MPKTILDPASAFQLLPKKLQQRFMAEARKRAPPSHQSTTCLTQAGFNALPQRAKAVLVAKDVIAQVALDKYNIQRNSYISFTNLKCVTTDTNKTLTPNMVNTAAAGCHVCAKGAVFLSSIRLGNHATMADLHSFTDDGRNYAAEDAHEAITERCEGKIFDPFSFHLIEAAFEQNWDENYSHEGYAAALGVDDIHDDQHAVNQLNQAVTFGLLYEDENDRLVAIMLNVIKHDGMFMPDGFQPTEGDVAKAFKEAKPLVIRTSPAPTKPKRKATRKAKRK